jgi:hypothetical protein
MNKRRRLRRSLAALIPLTILLAAGWTGVWYVVAGRVSDHVMAWEQQRRGEGWTITHGAPRRSGWPMAAGVTLPGITISGGARYLPGGLAWQAGALTIALDIRHLDALYLGVAGRQTLRIAGGAVIPFQAATFDGQVALTPDAHRGGAHPGGAHPGLLQLHASDLIAAVTAADGTRKPISISGLDAAVLADASADAGGNALVLAATITGVPLPPHLLPGAWRNLRRLAFDVAVSGPVPAAPQPAELGPDATETAWRNAGGTLALRAFHLADGPLTLDAQGQFRLDDFLRPEGTAILHVTGLDELMKALADNRTLTRPEARAIRAMLGLMMGPLGQDGLDAPLSLRGGVVSLGAIPLIRLKLN